MGVLDTGAADYAIYAAGSLTEGYGTWAFLYKSPAGRDASTRILSIQRDAGFANRLGIWLDGGNRVTWDNQCTGGTAVASTTLTVTNADGWIILVAAKATGNNTPRFSKYVINTQTWTRENATGPIVDATAGGGDVIMPYQSGAMGAGAFWSRALTDAETEILVLGFDRWLSLSPDAAMLMMPDLVTTGVPDRTGNGANLAALSAGVVISQDVPGFGMGKSLLQANPALTGKIPTIPLLPYRAWKRVG